MSSLWRTVVKSLAVSRKGGAGLLLLVLAWRAPGQEAIRMSQASQEAANERREAESALRNANMRLGPSVWRLSTTLAIEARDNATLSENDPQADVLLKPQLNTRIWWPITEKNSLNLSLGVGYMKYVRASDSGNVFIPAGTELSFDLFVGDAVINFHDRVRIWADAYENPTLSDTRFYQRMENVAGATANWDLNRLKFTLGYDHANYLSLSSALQQADGQMDSLFARAGYALSRTTWAGLESGVNLIDYSEPQFKDAVQYNVGPFWEGRLTEYVNIKASAGYTQYSPFGDGSQGITDDTGAVYGQLALNHRINEFLTYSLSGGRYIHSGVQYGLAGRNLDLTSVRWQGNWNLVKEFRINTPVFYERGHESGQSADDFNRYGVGITIGRQILRKLYGNVGYTFTRRDSNTSGRSYDLNMIAVNGTYTF